jgi:glycosyltransferase involved in cell wall biosynthesis
VTPELARVLFVIDGLWVGGSERSLAEMLPGLRQAGVSCSVAVLRPCAEGVENEVRSSGTEVHVLPGPGLLARVLGLRRLIAGARPQIVHSSLFQASLVARLAACGTPAQQLTSLVNAPYAPERLAGDAAVRRRRLRIVQAVDAASARLLTDHFHAVSEFAGAAAVRDLGIPAERVTVVRRGRDPIRLGAPSPERRAASRAMLGLGPDARIVVNVGREDFQKDQSALVGAFATLARADERLVLFLVGRRGSASQDIDRRIADSGVASRIVRLGHRGDVPNILAAADLFVFPSRWEGLPGAVIEAMALGLPIVASRIPSITELLLEAECGLLVPPGDEAALASSLGSLLTDASRRLAMGERGRNLFLERYTLEESVKGMTALYQRLLAGRNG